MTDAVRRNVAMALGIGVIGILFTFAAPALRLANGADGIGLIQSRSPVLALFAVIACLALGAALAVLVGRLVNTAVGLFTLGAGLFVLARRGGTFVELAFSGSSPGLLAIESILWAALLLAAVLAVFQFAGPLTDIEPEPDGTEPHWLISREALLSAGAGALVLPVVWMIAQSPMKGQVLAATILGSVVAGLAARLASPHVQPRLVYASVCVFAAVGYVIGNIFTVLPADDAFVNSVVSPLLLPMPVDYAAGSLLGVSMGLGWAKSFLHHEETPA